MVGLLKPDCAAGHAAPAWSRERELFEAFVYASVSAIELRDPGTAGHSFRVAVLTTSLAMAIDSAQTPELRHVKFGRDDVEQLKYASLLHDFGKLAIPESVLGKARRLPRERRVIIEDRIGRAELAGALSECSADDLRRFLEQADDPQGRASKLTRERRVLEKSGLLDAADVAYLRIERGSLSPSERALIQSHVDKSAEFLRNLPWPATLTRVPAIAAAHHERLDGSGYPRGATRITIEARILAICDIYDALVSSDRPYRAAVPHGRAMDELTAMRDSGKIDAAVLECFVDRRIHRTLRRVLPDRPGTR